MKQRLCTICLSAALAFCGCASVPVAGSWELKECNEIDLPSVAKSAGGIAWDGGDGAYVATDDRPALLCKLKLKFDGDGVLESASGKVLGMPEAASDSEAAAVDPLDGGIWIAHEVSNRVLKYRKDDPALAISRELKMPPIVKKARKGRGLESLAISADGLVLFTCTEEALVCDCERATRDNGTYVRLMRFVRDGVDSPWRPDGQWAYCTEPISGGAWNTKSGDASRNGISELCLAKDGTLLLLERDFSCTIMPRITRKIRMPTFHLSDRTVRNPSWNTWFSVPTRSKPAFRNAPVRIPKNRELYTSLVIKASAIAITGGVSAQAVSFTGIWLCTTA